MNLGERIAVLETVAKHQTTLMMNHIKHHETRDKWMMGILSALVVGVVLFALPGCADWLGGSG